MNDTRLHIIRTAFSLFISKSYKDVTMNEIVEKAELSKGGVYHHFQSKEELFSEVVNNFYFEAFTIHFDKLEYTSLKDFIRSIKAAGEDILRNMEAELKDLNKNGINFYMLLFDALAHLPGTNEKLIKLNNAELKAWMNIIKAAKKSGEIKSGLSDEQLASIFIYSSDGIGMRAIFSGDMKNIFTRIIEFWKTLYNNIKT